MTNSVSRSFPRLVYDLYADNHVPAPLTEEEIAAIDEAGAKGPPKRILVRLRDNAWLVLAVVLLHVVFFAYRFLL